jgi:hypothetical protein
MATGNYTGGKMSRQDIHAPKNFDPVDYEVVDFLDNKSPDYSAIFLGALSMGATSEACAAIVEEQRRLYQERIFEHFPNWRTGGDDHTSIFQCNHCGAHIRWVAVVEHKPTGKKLAFGDICADRVGIESRDAFRSKFIKDRAALEAKALENKLRRQAFLEGNTDVVEYLAGKEYDRNEFIASLAEQLTRKGELSEKQVAAVRKNIIRDAEFAARRKAEAANAGPFPEGRQTIEGEVVSVKEKEGFDGEPSYKILVKLDDGNKVYGSIPKPIAEWVARERADHRRYEGWLYSLREALTGRRVKFAAAFEVSDRDEHFGFYRRPTKAEVL